MYCGQICKIKKYLCTLQSVTANWKIPYQKILEKKNKKLQNQTFSSFLTEFTKNSYLALGIRVGRLCSRNGYNFP